MPTYRKIYTITDETRFDEGLELSSAMVKVAAICVFPNPYAHKPYSSDLSEITDESYAIGEILAQTVVNVLGGPPQSYGKAALVGFGGAIEHGVAAKSGEFGTAIRKVTGGTAWLASVSKRVTPGTVVDVPLASVHDVWVRSHYDAMTVMAADAPLENEIAIVLAAASGPRPHHRLGGMTFEQAAEAAR